MTGQEVQDKLDAIVEDLQTKGKGKTVNIMFRTGTNQPNILPLSSNGLGVVDVDELADIQAVVDDIKDVAQEYEDRRVPVMQALETFNTAKEPHEALFTASTTARATLSAALFADEDYQTAKANLETARANAAYVSAKTEYEQQNISENVSELTQAKGSYIA